MTLLKQDSKIDPKDMTKLLTILSQLYRSNGKNTSALPVQLEFRDDLLSQLKLGDLLADKTSTLYESIECFSLDLLEALETVGEVPVSVLGLSEMQLSYLRRLEQTRLSQKVAQLEGKVSLTKTSKQDQHSVC